jgi:hypothetical protein
MADRSKKETISFNQTILAGASFTGLTALKQMLRAPCTIQRIFGIFYSGQQGSLQVRPYLELTQDREEELITYPANSNRYLSGDNLNFDIYIDFDGAYGDQIKLDVLNTSIYDYTLQISFEVDYVGGTLRVV